MHYAEKLYLSGYITYPRTESTSYPVNFSHIDIIKCLDKSQVYNEFTQKILQNLQKPKKGLDKGDHPPITPTTNLPGDLQGAERLIYNFVVRNYLSSLYKD